MGQQQSSSNPLNCRNTQKDKINQITASKQFAIQINKRQKQVDKNDINQSRSVTRVSSAKFLSPRNKSQVSIPLSMNTLNSRNVVKISQKITQKIPEHESIIKVSLSPFPNSLHSTLKQNPSPYFIQPKLKTLGQIVESRYRTTKHLPYSQILTLMQSLVYGCAYLAIKNISFHDYYPTNIFYCNGKFKLDNPILSRCSGFSLTVQRKRFSFLSPELIIALLEQISQEQLGEDTLNKSDVFSIGMILLESCSLQPSSECYDQENYNIIDSVIRQRIAKVAKVYTPEFAECVNLMLHYQVQNRLDPILLSKIVYTKIQNQKKIAYQMENQHLKPQNQQVPKGVLGPPPQNMMLPPQKPMPYNHQPFKLQNLNQNSIAVPLPNQVYSRIGPNNQGFLSASTLQNKLRVIQLIHQNLNQSEEQEQEQKNKDLKVKMQKQGQSINLIQSQNTYATQQLESSAFDTKYPFVQSVYSKQVSDKKQTQMQRIRERAIQPQNKINDLNQINNINQNLDQRFVDVKIRPEMRINTALQNNMDRMPFYPISPKNTFPNMHQPSNYNIATGARYQAPVQGNLRQQYIPARQLKQHQIVQKQGFVTSAQTPATYKYSTSYQIPNSNIEGQSLQARVQRVLQMSRNVK